MGGSEGEDTGLCAQAFVAHRPALLRHLRYLVGDPGAAEDLAQETFLRWLRHGPRAPEAVAPWLRVVGTRIAYNYLRGERRRRLREARGGWAAGEAVGSGPADDDGAVRLALEALAPRDRLLLLLRARGDSYASIAPLLGLRASSVGTILARATARFRQAYTEAAGDGPGGVARLRATPIPERMERP